MRRVLIRVPADDFAQLELAALHADELTVESWARRVLLDAAQQTNNSAVANDHFGKPQSAIDATEH
jgi:hypothetical protein